MLDGYCGHVDAIEPVLSGWVSETRRPSVPVGFLLCLDGGERVAVNADRERADVAAARLAGPHCGFSVALPSGWRDGNEHELALLLPDGRRLSLPGLPPRIALGLVLAEVIPAEAAGLDAVLDLLRRTDAESGHDACRVGAENAAAFNAVRAAAEGFVFYARVGGRLVGYARLDRSVNGVAEVGVVALTVLAAYRRKGLGEGLMRVLLHAAAEAPGLRQVWLTVRPDNVPALRLYEKLGFRRGKAAPLGLQMPAGEAAMLWQPSTDTSPGSR